MNENEPVSDAALQAYLNGVADPETVARIEAAIADDPQLEARLMALDPLASQVKAAFAAVPPAARVEALKADVLAEATPSHAAPTRPSFGRAPMAACVLLALGLGFSAAWFIKPESAASTWQDQVAIYQALYTAETVAAIAPTESGLAAQFEKAEATLGRTVDRGTLSALPDLSLKRAQILAFGEAPIVQIVFAMPDGTPMAFCIIRLLDGEEMPADTETLAGLATTSWQDGDYGYMVVGGDDLAATQKIADALVAQF